MSDEQECDDRTHLLLLGSDLPTAGLHCKPTRLPRTLEAIRFHNSFMALLALLPATRTLAFWICRRRESVKMESMNSLLMVEGGNESLVPDYPATEIICLETIDVVSASLGISRSGVYDRMNSASKYFDPDFPRPIYLGESTTRFVVFEINKYIMKKMLERDSEVSPKKGKNKERRNRQFNKKEVVSIV